MRNAAPAESPELVGPEIFDRHGRARAWLIDLGDVAQLALAVEGDQVAILETVDAADGESSTSLALCDRLGRPVVVERRGRRCTLRRNRSRRQ